MTETLLPTTCAYCNTGPVNSGAGWQWTCKDCTYTCEGCKQVTPYEFGGDDELCDFCWAERNIT